MPVRSLAAAARESFGTRARERGDRYFWSHRVTRLDVDGGTLTAQVLGSRAYLVTLTLDGTRLHIECTCPQFVDHFVPCKHIWATILAADQRRAFPVPDGLWVDWTIDEALEAPNADPAPRQATPRTPAAPRPPAAWETFLSAVVPRTDDEIPARVAAGEVVYVLDVDRSAAEQAAVVQVLTRERRKSGEWGRPKPLSINRGEIARLPDERDREILELASGAAHGDPYGASYYAMLQTPSSFVLGAALQRTLLPRMSETGRLFARGVAPFSDPAPARDPSTAIDVPLGWTSEPAEFQLRIARNDDETYTIDGVLRVGDDARAIADAALITPAVILWRPDAAGGAARLAPFESRGVMAWVAQLSKTGAVRVPAAEALAIAEALAASNVSADCPAELRLATVDERPTPVLRLSRTQSYDLPDARLDAKLTFRYGGREWSAWSARPVVVDRERRIAYRRDRESEQAAFARLLGLGVRRVMDWRTNRPRLDVSVSVLPTLVRVLLAEGWTIEAEGRLYRRPGAATLSVTSGVDWFELHGRVDFDGVSASLPALLAAVRRREMFVPLGDGTFGVVPEDWLARTGQLIAMGDAQGDYVRFAPSQAALLDAWLASEPAVSIDAAFARVRDELARFDGVGPIDPPPSFRGSLRDYQREALGWFDFLRRFGFGGCLADEMGLGKTVMVLALLDARRLERAPDGAGARPSLVVVPRSLVFNWQQEAARFAPELRVLDYTGSDRRAAAAAIDAVDVVITTYGTLRRDIGELKDRQFDYVILDEAQAIKNARTNAAKVVRLLKARHRLALSGTPIENHLGELWSLFDFLNPGMLGASSVFAAAGGAGRSVDDETLERLAKGVRPFILRRTKEQVATELPPRTEQTLFCDLEPAQRALYDELRDHYRASLLGAVERTGLGRAKLQILEALLRLRQAACHPALIDPARRDDPSAKLDLLVPRLQELVEDGRKVLVFSQFTSFLALLRARLDEAALDYEYLDGRTRDRAARVARFQQQDCPLFLISLKAGGLGLNLTAAEHVFLLDPWWNPAVEAQAIDRTHRIGQSRPVFAFRLIARDTVEEKVLELQQAKRRLADAIVRADAGLIRDLRREDLELLLS